MRIVYLLLFMVSVLFSESLMVTWDANTESDLAGYKVYYGTESGNYTHIQDVGNLTKYVIAGLSSGVEYFVVLTAYDFAGNESDFSDEISAVAGEAQFSEFDLNQDGKVNDFDLQLWRYRWLRLELNSFDKELDFNNDGKVNDFDERLLIWEILQ